MEQILREIRQIVREEIERSRALAEPRFYTIDEVASVLRVSTRTVENLIASGEMPPPVRVGRQRRWHSETLEAFVHGSVSPTDNY